MTDSPSRRMTLAGTVAIMLLLMLRVPSLAEPMAADQGLYSYVGTRVLAGEVPYRDAWDQKPPGIHAAYAVMWRVWPHESVVALADLVAAGLVAWLLVILGRRTFGSATGYGAACLFLLFGNPAFQRLGGVYVRSQCETFIALAVTATLVLLAAPRRTRRHLIAAGLCLGAAFWLKYNALVYVLPMLLIAGMSDDERVRRPRALVSDLIWIAGGFIVVAALVLGWFAAHGALLDLKIATIDYNVRYARETYQGAASTLIYPFTMVAKRVHVDALWFLGGLGAVLLSLRLRARVVLMTLAWLAAAILCNVANGARGLPQYFVQANPALALAGAAGMASLAGRQRLLRAAALVVIVAGLVWKVGAEQRPLRLSGLPEVIDNTWFDFNYLRGQMDRSTYLERFGGQRAQDKFEALAVEQLTWYVASTTEPNETIYVFGFAPGVYVKSGRVSASRFLWSRPVIIEFAAGRDGYGSAGLLQDLERHAPAVVALQRQDWGPVAAIDPGRHGESNSIDFFHGTPPLDAWLRAHYTREADAPNFELWRRRP